jgi:YHS domain-containing protein
MSLPKKLAQWAVLPLAAAGLLAALAAPPALANGESCSEMGDHADKKVESADAPRSFAAKPKPGTKATCAVSGEVFKVTAKTKMLQEGGRWYPFCCADCVNDFKGNPAKYTAVPKS